MRFQGTRITIFKIILGATNVRAIHPADSAPQRIAKLLPAEMTAALLAINSALTLTTLPEETVVYVGLLIGLVSPVYFWFVLGTKNILHIVFLIASYLILFTTIASVELWTFFPGQVLAIAAASTYIALIWVFLITPIVAMLLGAKLMSNTVPLQAD